MAESSKVVHVRNVGHEISEVKIKNKTFSWLCLTLLCFGVKFNSFFFVYQNDLLQLFQPFGVITKLVMLRAKNQVS